VIVSCTRSVEDVMRRPTPDDGAAIKAGFGLILGGILGAAVGTPLPGRWPGAFAAVGSLTVLIGVVGLALTYGARRRLREDVVRVRPVDIGLRTGPWDPSEVPPEAHRPDQVFVWLVTIDARGRRTEHRVGFAPLGVDAEAWASDLLRRARVELL
jgi:hypothetical protein